MSIRVSIFTISDSAVARTREDRSGPAVEAKASELGWSVVERQTHPDERERIAEAVRAKADAGNCDVILTTGGTGVALRDVTPEAIASIADRTVPGFGELMRSHGSLKTKFAPLSRSGAYTRGRVLIVTLPGSPKGAVESLEAIAHLVPHVVDLLAGRTEHK
jgi:molybdopterin adenylyltransferase